MQNRQHTQYTQDTRAPIQTHTTGTQEHTWPAAQAHARDHERRRIWTTDLGRHAGERVVLAGWLHRFRQLRSVGFLIVRDAKGLAQVVVEDAALRERVAALHAETVLRVAGRAVAVPHAPGGVELHDPEVEVLSAAPTPPPFDLFRPALQPPLATLLDHQPVMLRHPRQRALFRLSAAAMAGFRDTLRALEFVEIQTPKLVGAATEGGANVFTVNYFGRPAYLSQSPQLYKQLMVGVFERVFEVGPAFRAEPHDTPRHLNEFVSLDAEMGFVEDHRDVMAVLTQTLRGMLDAIRAEAPDAVALLGLQGKLPVVPAEIPSVSFAEARQMVERATGEPLTETDLAPAHERWLGAWAQREHGSEFVFVTGYPAASKPFYTHPAPGDPASTNAFDLLFRGVELVSGGQRLHREEDYRRVLAERGMKVEAFADFLEAFRHGMPPHGGFAIGLERFVAQVTGTANVRETTLFPRDLTRLTP